MSKKKQKREKLINMPWFKGGFASFAMADTYYHKPTKQILSNQGRNACREGSGGECTCHVSPFILVDSNNKEVWVHAYE